MPLEFKRQNSKPPKKNETATAPPLLLAIPFAILFQSALCSHFALFLSNENVAYFLKQSSPPSGGAAFALNFDSHATALIAIIIGLLGLLTFAIFLFFTRKSTFLILANTSAIAATTWPWVLKSSIFEALPLLTHFH